MLGAAAISSCADSVEDRPEAAESVAGQDAGSAASAQAGSEPTAETTPSPTPVPSPTPEGPEPLVVVALLDTTGVMGPLDGTALAGAVAAVDILNENGGLLGRPVELRHIDTNARTSLSDRLALRLVDDPPDLVLISCDVDFSIPVLDIAVDNGWLTISPCADDVGYATAEFGRLNFTFGAPAQARGAIAAEVVLPLYGPSTMVLRDKTSPEALAFCDGFESRFVELGGVVSYRDEFTYDTLEPIQDRIAESAPPTSSIAVCSHVPDEQEGAPAIVELLRTLGFDAPIVAGTGVDQSGWFSSAPRLRDMVYVSWSSIYGNDPDPWVNNIVDRADSNSETPRSGVATVLGAESIDAWARAVRAAASAEPTRVADALGSFANERFATGRVSFLGTARMDTGRRYRVMRVIGEELTVLDQVETN